MADAPILEHPRNSARHEIEQIVHTLAGVPVLLVACDFDGTLSEVSGHPRQAVIDPAAGQALDRLRRLPQTHTAIISGRGLEDLRSRLSGLGPFLLAGSHGAEIDGRPVHPPAPEAGAALSEARARIDQIARATPGAWVETKPMGVAFHYRQVEDTHLAGAVGGVLALKDHFPQLLMRLGSMVIEFSADRASKGEALRYFRYRCGAAAVLFVGDDLTDEHAFAELLPHDAGVKLGPGDTRAKHRLAGVRDVAALLERLAQEREAWLGARRLVPLQAHSLISDQRALALLNPEGRIVWMCLPRADSPAIFAELLGGPAAGFFEIAPVEPQGPSVQEYDNDSLIVRTRWPGCAVTDYLDCAAGRAFQRAGRTDLIRVVEGTGRVRLRFAPRLDFGRLATNLITREGAVEIEGAQDPIILHAPGVAWEIIKEGIHHTAQAQVDLASGPLVLELRYGAGKLGSHPQPEPQRREMTKKFWSAWAQSLRVPDFYAAQVRRSALILRALCYGPTGAIYAAGTTSLPEHLGGVRNWDYRYCWPRDAALAAAALLRLGNTGTAMRLLDWLLGVLDNTPGPERLRPIYTVTGGHLGPEAEIGDLAGYGGSRPVRVGNAAAQQVQLDVFGPITDLVAMLVERGAPVSPDHWRVTRAMVEAVEARWHEPDHGIWEIRGPKRHHVHSKAMCFHTVDRAMLVHEYITGRPHPGWAALREQIRQDILANGFCERVGAFTCAYGCDEIDAAALQLAFVGVLDATDPRYIGTLNAVERTLRRGSVVYRYLYDDTLPGPEGGFHLCTSWLIEALARVGRVEDARRLFEELVALVGPTGLLCEQYDPAEQQALGNVPQAYSHLALINAAVLLSGQSGAGEHA